MGVLHGTTKSIKTSPSTCASKHTAQRDAHLSTLQLLLNPCATVVETPPSRGALISGLPATLWRQRGGGYHSHTHNQSRLPHLSRSFIMTVNTITPLCRVRLKWKNTNPTSVILLSVLRWILLTLMSFLIDTCFVQVRVVAICQLATKREPERARESNRRTETTQTLQVITNSLSCNQNKQNETQTYS